MAKYKNDVAWFEDGSLNAAHNALDKYKNTPIEQKSALIYESESGDIQIFTFSDLIKISNKIANYLTRKGVMKGDRVFLFLPRIPEIYISF